LNRNKSPNVKKSHVIDGTKEIFNMLYQRNPNLANLVLKEQNYEESSDFS